MLDNFYEEFKKHPISVNKNILEDEISLDSCLNLFIRANENFYFDNNTVVRSSSAVFPSFNFLKDCVISNCALRRTSESTRIASEETETLPAYLSMFYDVFFNSADVEMSDLDSEILNAIEKVKSSYPNLTEEELEGLFFVAGVTYNSCVYWYYNADKWIEVLTNNQKTRSSWLWDGVKNGVKKWAKADGGGAIKVWTANKIAGVASGGTALLAGAAVGSVVGAWNNLPLWD